MPKEYRAPSHSHRTNLAPLPQVEASSSGTRVTGVWNLEDDQVLMEKRASGMNWAPIAAKFFPQKSANACRKRHERLMERRNAEDWDGGKAELLATQYMAFRAEIWKPLADSLNEKWQTIEAKCMAAGLKNLQATDKAAKRKERGMGEHDSGFGGCSDTECDVEMDPPAESSRAPAQRTASNPDHPASTGRSMSIQGMLSPSPPA